MNRSWFKSAALFVVAFSLLLNPIFATPVHALNAPVPVAPANGTTTTPTDTPPLAIPEFRWTAVSGAASYRIQVSNNIAFTTNVVDITTTNTSYTPNTTNGFSDGTWFWRVRAETPAPAGAYSAIWSFTKQWAAPANAPALTAPADAAVINFYDHPIFSWGAVTGAAKYKLQVYSSPGGWSSLSYNPAPITLATSHQPNIKLPNGIYYWRVVPLDVGNREGTPSEERSFTVNYSFVPILLEPADNATPTFTPTFRWTAVRGAQYYRLQYSTDPSFGANVTTVDTRNTAHTPVSTIPNDQNYYWRVRAASGSSVSDWTTSRTFIKRWYIKPVLLTPTNNYQHLRFPLFSWTPVPGTAKYFVEISKFNGMSPIYDSGYTANTFFSPTKYEGALQTYYWRVTPIDGDGRNGISSLTSSYVSYYNSVAPHPVYPLYYYPPDTYPGFPGVTTNPHEDRTVPLPIFIWHRVLIPVGGTTPGDVYGQAYRVQVSTDATFNTVNWTVDTENTVAAPTTSNPFTPATNTDYFWRVRPLIGGVEAGQWSQVWKTRFNPAKGLTPTVGTTPTLIRPTTGFEYGETTPLLEWFPLSGATSYDVQISRDSSFGTTVDTATVSSPAYAPTQSLAQRNLGDLDFGIYYWRVRKTGTANWSEVRRFQISAQSQWKYTRTPGDTANRLQIGSDAASDVTSNYDVTSLHAAQSSSSWYFGFHVPNTPTQNVTYALYLDLDHQDASGATSDARGYAVTTISAYRPEYAIYVLQEGGAYSAAKSYLYRWNGSSWDPPQAFDTIGGALSKNGNYVELQLQNTAIGHGDTTGSYAISLFSLPASSGQPQDSVPSDPAIPGAGPISRFSNVTERMNLVMPPNDAGIDPSTFPSILPFFWDYPIIAPYSGAIMKAYLDPFYTTESDTYTLTSDTAYYAQNSHAWGDDFSGDNTYYWRVQPRYRDVGCNPLCSGAWSQGWRFERQGFVPQNLETSVTFATPTFSWDMVEGAESYDLQVSTDPGFNSFAINTNTRQSSYTWTDTLGNATYYWHVRVRRNGNPVVTNNWTASQSFTLALPSPTGLTHIPAGNPSRAPTLCWTPLIVNSQSGDPVLAAWKYRVQVSKDPSFSIIFDNIDTEQRCWTPTKGYDDGQYYWRVAMIDGANKPGNYTTAQTFTKQYPMTTLVSPASGATPAGTPTFVWTRVFGAAKYKFEVSKYPNFSPMHESVITDNVRWTPTTTYPSSGTYYWRVAIVDADNKVGPFVGSTVIIDNRPRVSISGNAGVGAATISYTGGSTSADGSGNYTFSVLSGWSGTVTPSKANYTFSPTSRSYSNVTTNRTAQNFTATPLPSSISGNTGVAGVTLSYFSGTPKTVISQSNGNYSLTVPNMWTGTVTPAHPCFTFTPANRSYSGVVSNQTSQNYSPAFDSGAGCADVNVSIGGANQGRFGLPAQGSTRASFTGVDNGPVKIESTNTVQLIGAERVIYKVNNINTSFSEMMGLPGSQLDNIYWLPWYNNVNLDTQLRIANVSGSSASVNVYIGGTLRTPTPIILGPGESTRQSFAGVDAGPVQIVSDQNIVAAERVIYKVNNINTSFSEMMALPDGQLDTTYWLPWYNNIGLDTQLRFANTTNQPATVHIFIGGVEMGTGFTLQPNESTRQSFTSTDNGPVQIVSNQSLVVAERVIYKVSNVNTSFSEMMALPNGMLDSTYWLPWYNNINLDTQLRFGVP